MKPAESSKLRDNVTGTCTTATNTTNAYVTLDLYEYVHVVSVTMAATVAGLFIYNTAQTYPRNRSLMLNEHMLFKYMKHVLQKLKYLT